MEMVMSMVMMCGCVEISYLTLLVPTLPENTLTHNNSIFFLGLWMSTVLLSQLFSKLLRLC